ncbi:MAG: hypothetical protein KAW45_03940 [Thermoplasmatales archaeon]|nr:hypothetical protein [Thermoplasmatales archaeon]
MKRINKKLNPWTSDDEKEHFPSNIEWWCTEAFFKTKKDKKIWNLKAVLTEWCEGSSIGSFIITTIFDQTKNKSYNYHKRDEKNKLKTDSDNFDVSFEKSFMKGLFPDYSMIFKDNKNDIKIDMKQEAISIPHWIAQDITDGWLPLGSGSYRYGFIPKTKITGTMAIKDKKYDIEGIGYIEHVWGNFEYDKIFVGIKNIPKTLKVYTKLIGWRIHELKPRIPESITFGSENNPFGYDWVWAILDNGWTVFFGNIMFWLMDGPSMGTLIISKDDETYQEYADVQFHYNHTEYAKNFDFIYPTDLTITARKGEEKFSLRFKMTCETKEYIARFPDSKYWTGFVIVESPGEVDGYYSDGKTKIKLSGICKIEPQRQVSIMGHNMLKLDFLKPPKGFGITINFDSHYFKKRLFTRIQFLPNPKMKFKINKINNTKIKREK